MLLKRIGLAGSLSELIAGPTANHSKRGLSDADSAKASSAAVASTGVGP